MQADVEYRLSLVVQLKELPGQSLFALTRTFCQMKTKKQHLMTDA